MNADAKLRGDSNAGVDSERRYNTPETTCWEVGEVQPEMREHLVLKCRFSEHQLEMLAHPRLKCRFSELQPEMPRYLPPKFR